MTANSSQTNIDLKTGVKVTVGFFVMSLVFLVLVSFLFKYSGDSRIGIQANSPEPVQTEPVETTQTTLPLTDARTELPASSRTELPGPVDGTEPEPIRSEPFELESDTPVPATPTAVATNEIPALLTASDVNLYRRIFALQKRGRIKDAKKIAIQLENKLLMGHVLAQRLQRQARPSYTELRRWLRNYADHPDYGRIKRLAHTQKKRRSRKTRPPPIPRNSLIAAPPPSASYASKKNLTRKQRRRVSRIKRTARIWLRRGQISRTERLLRRGYVVRLLDHYEMDETRGMIAAAWFYYAKDKKAYRLATKVIARSGRKLPVTHWIAGLSSWRMGKTERALTHFEKLAEAPGLSGWISAGAALWAARANDKLGNEPEERRWLEKAAQHPYTLYGVLALTELGRDLPFQKRHHPLTAAKVKLLMSTNGGRRALALSEVGEMLRAEQELLRLKEWKRPGMRDALRAVADQLQFPSIAIKLTRHQVNDDDDGRAGEPLDPALYPIPPWNPTSKSGIDRALLYAIMRQESDFNAFAHSPVGALGLMQIMPDTARMLNRGRRPFRGTRRLDKYDPKIIVKFGQRYLIHLRTHKRVKDDLIKVIAAYNSGPGNIGYWSRKRIKHQKDPLLFVESIPNLETRLFVRRVLANLWIYRHRLDQSAPSLQAFAAGRFPRYRPIDGKRARRTAAEIRRHSDG
jgi:soluble lytic murein transglycosylase-like protein